MGERGPSSKKKGVVGTCPKMYNMQFHKDAINSVVKLLYAMGFLTMFPVLLFTRDFIHPFEKKFRNPFLGKQV
jgi:hypothetical protein